MLEPPSKRISAQLIQSMATRYLNRYAPTISHFRSVLQRKVRRITSQPEELQAAFQLIEHEVQRRIDTQALDDQHITEGWIRRFHQRGLSPLVIRQKLRQKGISDTMIEKNLHTFFAEHSRFQAALNYAKRRRLGPFQTDIERREQRRKKDIAAMMRAGHPYDICKTIINAATPDEAQEANESRQWK